MLKNLSVAGTPFSIDGDGFVCITGDGRARERVSRSAEDALLRFLEAKGLSSPLHGEEISTCWKDARCYARVGQPVE